jgi:membrane-bound lytic murein transglycosylase D
MRPNITKHLFTLALSMLITLFLTAFTNDDGVKSKKNPDKAPVDSRKTASDNSLQFELNPQVVPFVTNYLSKESDDLQSMRKWCQPYFDIFEKVFSSNDLPVQLKYLSVIESGLQSNDVSSKGAVGPWQLMPDEAKRFGLKMNDDYDERTNFRKSTVVAAKILKELYGDLGDWLLVIAAYNAGEGRVKQAINRAGSASFWDLQYYLPQETRNHVKKYIATHYFFEGGGGWTTLTAAETNEKKSVLARMQNRLDSLVATANIESMQIVGKYNAAAVANYLSMDIDEFNKLNPGFDKALSEGHFYNIRLPLDKMDIFEDKRQFILQQSVEMMLSGSVANK